MLFIKTVVTTWPAGDDCGWSAICFKDFEQDLKVQMEVVSNDQRG